MNDSPPQHRLAIIYEGHVQGVGFRWTAARAARRAGVTGWVRNESDGSVRLVAEAASERLDRLLQLIRDEMGGNIRSERIERVAATGEFASFEIRQ